jgi:hypothetical protein
LENQEQKEQKPKEQKEAPKEPPKEAPKEPAKEASKKEPKETPKEAPKERPKECISCNKSLKKRWYYREGGYYCGKSCWKKTKKDKEKTEAESKKAGDAK